MNGSTAADSTLAGAGNRRPVWHLARIVTWGMIVTLAALAAVSGVGGALLVFIPLLMGLGAALLGRTLPLLWLLIATSGIGFGWIEEAAMKMGGNTIHFSGLRWGLVFLVAGIVLLRDGVPPIPRPLRAYIAFLAFSTVAILWSPDRFEGVKDVMQYATPLLVALIAIQAVRTKGDARVLRTAFWIGLAVAAVAGLTLGIVGLGGGRLLDEGRTLHRSTGPYLLPLMALALAAWRYRGGMYALLPMLVFLLGLLTLSRATVLVMLTMGALSTWGRPLRWYFGAALALMIAGSLALQYQPFRQRVFGEGGTPTASAIVAIEGEGADAQIVVKGISLSGRGLIWLRTMRHALEAPWLGHGTGSATYYLVSEVAMGIDQPHNEYIRLFHDGGVLGLLMFLWAAWRITRHLVRLHARADRRPVKEAALAASLAFAGALGIFVFDNALVNPNAFTQNVFILLVLADAATRAGEPEHSGSAPAHV